MSDTPQKKEKISDAEFFEQLERKKRTTKLVKRLKAELRSLLTMKTRTNLYEVSSHLGRDVKEELGVNLQDLFAYIQDPAVAARKPAFGILPFEVRWEPGVFDGPTSARFAVVDYCMDNATLHRAVAWNAKKKRFESDQGTRLDSRRSHDFHFHQVNVWAVAQTVLDFFEDGLWGMGRPIPWGFNENRLLLVPHAGYGENAFYDRHSKSLQFYYCGDLEDPVYTCLSHDIIAHETGHALLDGIRPLYFEYTSVETAAFHEFVGDLTALLVLLRRNEVRGLTALETKGDLRKDDIITGLAEQFGNEINGSRSLRCAHDHFYYPDIGDSQSPHRVSRVLSTAMFEILIRITDVYRNDVVDEHVQRPCKPKKGKSALQYAVDRFPRIAFRAIDMCPPMDVRFIDYVRAVIHNYETHEPGDSPRLKTISNILRDVFHEWGFCQRNDADHVKGICNLNVDRPPPRLPVCGDIVDVSRSRTAAYYYINDNRTTLGIPPHEDIEIVDLYGLNKKGQAARQMRREIVIQYLWREEEVLKGKAFGPLKGKTVELLCGGTLVLDESGNIISFFHKPGSQSQSAGDKRAGKKRLRELKVHFKRQAAGRLGFAGSSEVEAFGPWTPSVVADDSNGSLRLEIVPHARETFDPDGTGEHVGQEGQARIWDYEEDEWTTNF